jgi:phage-related protein
VNLHYQVRRIAEWLDGTGELSFDFEPNMNYNAYVSSPPPLTKLLDGAIFEVEFTMNHPFAYENMSQVKNVVSSDAPGNNMDVTVSGTTNTPVKLIIKNNTDRTLTKLKITHKHVKQ